MLTQPSSAMQHRLRPVSKLVLLEPGRVQHSFPEAEEVNGPGHFGARGLCSTCHVQLLLFMITDGEAELPFRVVE